MGNSQEKKVYKVLRWKIRWQIIAYIFAIYIISFNIVNIDKFTTLKDWGNALGGLILALGIFFAIPYHKIIIRESGISGIYKIAIGFLVIWQKKIDLNWSDVNGIYSIVPLWLPLAPIIVSARKKQKKTINF